MAYSTHATVIFDLLEHTTDASLKAAIDKVPYTRGLTNTPDALATARNMLNPANNRGARLDPVPKIAVLMTGKLKYAGKSLSK